MVVAKHIGIAAALAQAGVGVSARPLTNIGVRSFMCSAPPWPGRRRGGFADTQNDIADTWHG